MITEKKLDAAKALIPDFIRKVDAMHYQKDKYNKELRKESVRPYVRELNILLHPFYIEMNR